MEAEVWQSMYIILQAKYPQLSIDRNQCGGICNDCEESVTCKVAGSSQ